jgi:hypothetical protein
MGPNTDLLCKDCKHGFQLWYDRLFMTAKRHSLRCKMNYKSSESDENLVVGPKIISAHYQLCSISRFRSGPCGPEGKLWHPKNEKKMFLTWIKHTS